MRVLLVEDDEILTDGLKVGLELCGFTVDAVCNVADAKASIREGGFDVVVLDLMLPDGSGLDVLETARTSNCPVPFLLLTARDEVSDRIVGLDAGADDYLGKPVDLDELAARLRAIFRRSQGRAESLMTYQGVTLDPAKMIVTKSERDVPLSRREFAILHALMQVPGIILSKSVLEEKLYGWQEGIESNTIEVHVHKLRAKLGNAFIETVRGVGYRLGSEK